MSLLDGDYRIGPLMSKRKMSLPDMAIFVWLVFPFSYYFISNINWQNVVIFVGTFNIVLSKIIWYTNLLYVNFKNSNSKYLILLIKS